MGHTGLVADSPLGRAADALTESITRAEDLAVQMYQGSSAEVEVTDTEGRRKQDYFLGFMRVDADWVFTWRKKESLETSSLLSASIRSRMLAAKAIPALFWKLNQVQKSHALGVDETVARLYQFLDELEKAKNTVDPTVAFNEVVNRFIQSDRTETTSCSNPPETPVGTA